MDAWETNGQTETTAFHAHITIIIIRYYNTCVMLIVLNGRPSWEFSNNYYKTSSFLVQTKYCMYDDGVHRKTSVCYAGECTIHCLVQLKCPFRYRALLPDTRLSGRAIIKYNFLLFSCACCLESSQQHHDTILHIIYTSKRRMNAHLFFCFNPFILTTIYIHKL